MKESTELPIGKAKGQNVEDLSLARPAEDLLRRFQRQRVDPTYGVFLRLPVYYLSNVGTHVGP